MYRILPVVVLLAMSAGCQSQPSPVRGEFATNSNGLMYGDNDMKALRFIVDSLNLRFKSCALNKTFYSRTQTRVLYAEFESKTNDLKEIRQDIRNNMSFEKLVMKYSAYLSDIDTLGTVIHMGFDKDEKTRTYIEGNPGEGYDYVDIDEQNGASSKTRPSGWIYDYSPKDKYSDEYSISCRFFRSTWQTIAIPAEYGRLIQYVDCMIDTSSYVFLTASYESGWRTEDEKKKYSNLKVLADYIDQRSGRKNNNSSIRELNESQLSFAEKHLVNDVAFQKILGTTIDDYATNKTANHQLEALANDARLYDKALLMKRCYRIMGNCSQDTRPREHARNIASLAARAHSWDIFLRAHLDIMNDRFERASDGSYAWDSRKTYLKELEELNLNIVDLMLGLTLRASNVAENHYYGTIWRMGWALTESKEKDGFENKAFAMMKDERLDEFNRGLVFLLYKTYLSYLDEKEALQKVKLLKDQVSSFPDFIQPSIKAIREKKTPGER